MSGAHKDHGEHCDGCILLGYVDRAEKAEARLAAIAEVVDQMDTNTPRAQARVDALRAILTATTEPTT